MDILIIFAIALVTFFVTQKISKVTNIAPPIIYLVVGLIGGFALKTLELGAIADVLPSINLYNNTVLLLMFFAAGFSVNINSIKKSGKLTVKLFSIPAYVETIVVGIVIFGVLQIAGKTIGITLSMFESIMISSILAVASPANIVPACVSLMQNGYSGKNNIPGTMLAVSVVDGFITIPVIIVCLVVAIAQKTGSEIGVTTLLLITVASIVGVIAICLLGVLIGKVVLLIVNPLLVKIKSNSKNKNLPFVALLISFGITLAVITMLSKIPGIGLVFSTFGILLSCVIGATIKHFDKSNSAQIVSQKGNLLFAILGMPIVFIFVGCKIDTNVLFNPIMLAVGVTICTVAFIVKGLVTKFILRDDRFSEGERKFAASCFIPKGVTLINFSVVFLPITSSVGMNYLIDFMIMLAAMTIIVTMTVGVTLINKAQDKWLFRDELKMTV